MKRPVWTHPILGALAAAALAACPGCGEGHAPTFPVTGEVVFEDGSPLKGGWVQFHSVEMDPPVVARGTIGDDGKFQLKTYEPGDGAPTGKYQVVVRPKVPRDRGTLGEREYARAMEPIDPAFKSFESSGLEFTVTEDPSKNHYRIVVWPPRS